MLDIIDSLWLFISAVIALVILGLIAGFSPTLYITQIGISTNSKRARSLMVALMIGVILGIVVLSILFQFFQLDVLLTIIDSTVSALFVSVIFNIIIGAIFVAAGFWYINKKPNRITKVEKPAPKTSYWALVSLGFFRTFASISGATATFITSGIIADVRVGIVTRLLFTLIFLVAAIAPFALILITMRRFPDKIESLLGWFKSSLVRFNYKLVLGVGSVLVGSGIIIFNVLKAITF